MINDSFLFHLLKTSGSVSFKDNGTLLPGLYSLLTLDFFMPQTSSWFKSKFHHYNSTFISTILLLPFGTFRLRFLNYESHNERYASHFYNYYIVRAHCVSKCDICSSHDNIHESKIKPLLENLRSSYSSAVNFKFQPFVRDFEIDHYLLHTTTSVGLLKNYCSISYTLPAVRRSHFYCFTYQSMLEYAYYNNLSLAYK